MCAAALPVREPEPTQPRTPPARAYTSPAVLEEEIARVFRSSWLMVGPADAVAAPMSHLAVEVAGTPVLITRDRDGELRAMANVCQHRGMVLTEGAGVSRTITCPNHAWTYGLDGQLRGAPRSSHEADFDCASIRLPRYAVHQWGPLLLVNLDPDAVPPLEELGRVDATLAGAGLDLATMRLAGTAQDWRMRCNWKIAIENYLECYHCAWVHKDFAKVVDVSHERYALQPRGNLLCVTAPVKETADRDRQQALLSTEGPMTDSHWYLLFPTTTINVYPGQGAVELTWYWPEEAGGTGSRTLVLVPADASESYAEQVTALLTQVGEEDIAICESMHRGMASGAIARSRVLPENEALITSFHDLLRARIDYPEGVR